MISFNCGSRSLLDFSIQFWKSILQVLFHQHLSWKLCTINLNMNFQVKRHFTLPFTVKEIWHQNQRNKNALCAKHVNLVKRFFFLSQVISCVRKKKLGNTESLLTYERLKIIVLNFVSKNFSLAVIFTPVCGAVKLTEIKCPSLIPNTVQPAYKVVRIQGMSAYSVRSLGPDSCLCICDKVFIHIRNPSYALSCSSL